MAETIALAFRRVSAEDSCRARLIGRLTHSNYRAVQLRITRPCEGSGKCDACLLRPNERRKLVHSYAFAVSPERKVHAYIDQDGVFDRTNWDIVLLRVNPNVMKSIFNHLRDQMKKPFNWWGMVLAAAPSRSVRWGCRESTLDCFLTTKYWFCSELFSCVLAMHGLIDDCVPCKTSPQILYELWTKRGAYQI